MAIVKKSTTSALLCVRLAMHCLFLFQTLKARHISCQEYARTVIIRYNEMIKQINCLMLSILLFASCMSYKGCEYAMPDFPITNNISVKVLSEELLCNMVCDIFECDNRLYVVHYDKTAQTWCNVYDKQKGGRLFSCLHAGNGPKEIIANPICSSYQDSLFFFDMFADKVLSFSKKENCISSEAIKEDSRMLRPYTRNISVLEKGEDIIVLNQIGYNSSDTVGYHRIQYYDNCGNEKCFQDFAPYPDSRTMFGMYTQSLMAVSPDCKKLVIGSVWGAILEFYSVPDLEGRKVLWLVDPAIDFREGTSLTKDTKAGLRDLCADNDNVYASIGADVNILSNNEKGIEEMELKCNDLYVFDWEGNPVRHIVTDYNIEKFCLTQSSDTLYTVVSNKEGALYLGMIVL